jgi:Fic family protein
MKLLGELELFINVMKFKTPPLLKAALAQVQFETIHPFLDGNGRLGRLLNGLSYTNTVYYISRYYT